MTTKKFQKRANDTEAVQIEDIVCGIERFSFLQETKQILYIIRYQKETYNLLFQLRRICLIYHSYCLKNIETFITEIISKRYFKHCRYKHGRKSKAR